MASTDTGETGSRKIVALGRRRETEPDVEPDAAQARQHDLSIDVLAEMLRKSTEGSPEARVAMQGLSAKLASTAANAALEAQRVGLLGVATTRRIIAGISLFAVVAPAMFGFVSVVASWLGPDRAALERIEKTQRVLVQFVVASELARAGGGPPPKVPPALSIIVLQDEADTVTGTQ